MDPQIEEQPAPPLWSEVKSDPGFQKLPPEKQLVAFARWHDDVYNHLQAQPDWDQNKDVFNTKAAQEQERLSKLAGGLTPDDARVKVARAAVAQAGNGQDLSKEQERNVLRPLGPDVWKAYYNDQTDANQPVPGITDDLMHQAANVVRIVGATAAKGVAESSAFFTAPDDPTAHKKSLDEQIAGFEKMRAAPGVPLDPQAEKMLAGLKQARTEYDDPAKVQQKTEAFHAALTDLHNTLENIDPEFSIDPRLKDTVPARVAALATGTGAAIAEGSIPGIGIPLLLAHSGTQAWGSTLDATKGDSEAANRALIRSVAANLVFMAAGHGANTGLGKLLEQTKAGPMLSLATRITGGAAANVAIGQATSGAEAALEAPAGEKFQKFWEAVNKPEFDNIAQGIAFGVLGAKPIESLQRAAEVNHANRTEAQKQQAMADLQKAQAEASVKPQTDALEVAGAPQTAAALKEIVSPIMQPEGQTGATGPEVKPPEIRLASTQSADGSFSHSLQVAPEATAEQLTAFRDKADLSHLPDAEQEALRAQLDRAIAAKEGAQAPAAEAPQAPIAGPALTDADGNILLQGRIGETHSDLVARAMAGDNTELRIAAVDALGNDSQHMFVDTNGAVHDRTEAAKRAVAAGQAPEGTKRLTSEILRDAAGAPPASPNGEQPQGEPPASGRTPALQPDRPLPGTVTGELPPPPSEYEVAKQAFLSLPPEERAKQIDANRSNITAGATKSGLLPRLGQIRADAGKGAREFWDGLKQQLAALYPPEPVPEGAKEVMVKVEGQNAKLPAISENGVVRPRFTNDPATIAKQIETGTIGTDEGKRLYISNEIMDSDTVNPAIDVAYDKAKDQFYVKSVKHEFGQIEKPGDLSRLLKENEKEGEKAHAMVFVGDPTTLEAISNTRESRARQEDQSIGQQLHENDQVFKDAGIPAEHEAVDVEIGQEAAVPGGVTPTTEQAKKMIDALKTVGILTEKGGLAESPIGKLVSAVKSRQLPVSKWLQTFARNLTKSGIDLSKIDVKVVNRPNAKYSGLYRPDSSDVSRGTITINVGVGHDQGVMATIFHELIHHTTLVKLDPNYKRNKVEQRALDNLQQLFDHAAKEVYKQNFGKDPTSTELEEWKSAQDTRSNSDMKNRAYYMFSGLHEFLTEAVTNPRAMKVLSQIEGLPGQTGSRFKNLLKDIHQYIKEFFAGQQLEKGSVLDQSLDHILDIASTEAKPGRARDTVYSSAETARGAAPPKEDLTKLSRQELEDRVLHQDPQADPMLMTTGEMREFLQPAQLDYGQARAKGGQIGDNHYGWLGSNGKFHEADYQEHDATARQIIADNPKLSAAYQRALEKQPSLGSPEETGQGLTDFMIANGYVRVAGGGQSPTYIQGKPTASQRRVLIDAAIERNVPLIHDFGGRSRLIHDPTAFSPAANVNPKITHTIGADGTTSHDVEIPADATPESLRAAQARVEASRVPAEAKVEMLKKLSDKLAAYPLDSAARRYTALQEEIANQPDGATEAQAKELDSIKAKMPAVVDHPDVVRSAQALGVVPGFVDIHDALMRRLNAARTILGTLPPVQKWGSELNAANTQADLFTNQKVNEMKGTLTEAMGRSNQAPGFGKTTKEVFGVGRKERKVKERDAVALSFVIEAQGDINKLTDFKNQIEAAKGQGYGYGWSKMANEAIKGIDHAIANWDRLQLAAPTYTRMMQDQVRFENLNGMATNYRNGYVPHLQEQEVTALDELLGGGGAGAVAGTGFKKMRVHDTFADSLGAGVTPKTLNAIDAMENRIKRGAKAVNRQQWAVNSGRGITDPLTGLPLTTDPVTQEHPVTGEKQQSAPPGYVLRPLGNQMIAVNKEYAKVFDGFLAPSAIRSSPVGNALLQSEGLLKHGLLVFDTYHVGRLAAYQAALGRAPTYAKGLLISDYSPAEINNMERRGELPKGVAAADILRQKADLDTLVKAGYNIGTIQEALNTDFVRKLPFFGRFNRYVFEEYQRGGMVQSGLMELQRQRKMFPELNDHEVARKVAKELNTRFGNLGKEGVFKNDTMRDLGQLLLLAPSWNEGLIKSEIGAVTQGFRAAKDLTIGVKDPTTGDRSRQLRAGSLFRGTAAAMLGGLAMAQILNYASRGHSTFENPEEGLGSKISAYIPDFTGDGPGFFFNPMALPAEYMSQLIEVHERGNSALKTIAKVASYKFSPVLRALQTGYTRKDMFDRTLLSDWDVAKQMMSDVAPLPIGLTTLGKATVRAAQKAVTGKTDFPEQFKGEAQRQAFSSLGAKLQGAPSDATRIYRLAKAFNDEHGVPPKPEFAGNDYQELTNAINNHDPVHAQKAFELLLKTKDVKKIDQYYAKQGTHPFTGDKKLEGEFYASLNPEQKRTYDKAVEAKQKIGQEYFRFNLKDPTAGQ